VSTTAGGWRVPLVPKLLPDTVQLEAAATGMAKLVVVETVDAAVGLVRNESVSHSASE